jgi:hypothetical protein
MSSLRDPTAVDWELWEPKIKDRYKKVTAEFLCREMADNGLRVT